MIADLIRIEQNFWENYVLKRQMPSPDGSKLADSVIAEYYKPVSYTHLDVYKRQAVKFGLCRTSIRAG